MGLGGASGDAGVAGVLIHEVEGVAEVRDLPGSQANASLRLPAQVSTVAAEANLERRCLTRVSDLNEFYFGVVVGAEEGAQGLFKAHNRIRNWGERKACPCRSNNGIDNKFQYRVKGK